MTYYPKSKPRTYVKRNEKEICPVCNGGMQVRDGKTHELRACVACLGTGWITMVRRRWLKEA